MSDLHAAPAGWYPEPNGTDGQRWWDGTRWTEYATPLSPPPQAEYAPYGSATQVRVADGTPVDTVWIWLIVVLPIVAIIPFFLWDTEEYLQRSMAGDPTAELGVYGEPMYLASVLLSWGAYAASIVFAYFDMVALRKLGYATQFHWAWTFLGALVYVIGRSVVVKRQAGHGTAVMWIAITLYVAVFVGMIVWIVAMVTNAMGTMIDTYPAI
jgi:hypothetical protein